MRLIIRNCLDYGSVTQAFENNITFSMIKKAIEYHVNKNLDNLEETTYCYFTPYNNVVNIMYEVIDINNTIVIDINDFYIDYNYQSDVINEKR